MSRLLRLIVVPVALVALAACGDDDASSSSTSAATSPTTTGGATTTGESASTTGGSGATTSAAPGELEGALLTADDIGEGFTATSAEPDDPDETTPCGTPSVQKEYPPEEQAGVDIDNAADELFFNQRIFVYPDDDTASQALATGKEGLACDSGTAKNDDGTETSFSLKEVATGDDVGEEAFAYSGKVSVQGQDYPATFVAIRQGRAITTLTFLSTAGNEGPEIGPIAATAADRLATVG